MPQFPVLSTLLLTPVLTFLLLVSANCAGLDSEGDYDESGEGDRSDVAISPYGFWPGGDVYLLIAPGFEDTAVGRKLVEAQIELAEHSAIRINFIYDAHQAPAGRYTRFTARSEGAGGEAPPGTTSTIGEAEASPESAKHELGHILGLLHTQQRPDRDVHITIHRTHIKDDMLWTFTPQPYKVTIGPYDPGSVMQYGSFAGSRNRCATMTVRDHANPSNPANNPDSCFYQNATDPKHQLDPKLRIVSSADFSAWNLVNFAVMYCEPEFCGTNCASQERCNAGQVAYHREQYATWLRNE